MAAATVLAIAVTVLVALHLAMPGWYARWWYPLDYAESISRCSNENSLDPALVAAVIYTESQFDRLSTSPAGAVGLMQIMPGTGRWIAEEHGTVIQGDELRDPEINIAYGCWYLRYLLDRYRNPSLALAAYNGGIENVDSWMAEAGGGREFDYTKDIPFKETRDYVSRVETAVHIYERAYPAELGTE